MNTLKLYGMKSAYDEIITNAVTSYVQDVKNRDFPNDEEAY